MGLRHGCHVSTLGRYAVWSIIKDRHVTYRLSSSHSQVSKLYQLIINLFFNETLAVTPPDWDHVISPKITVATVKREPICIAEGRGFTGAGARKRENSSGRLLQPCRLSRLQFFQVVAAVYSLLPLHSLRIATSQSFVATPDRLKIREIDSLLVPLYLQGNMREQQWALGDCVYVGSDLDVFTYPFNH